MKIYTKKGDQGNTTLVSGTKVLKSSLRLETYGTIDELNSFLGLALTQIRKLKNISEVEPLLDAIQNQLFNLGSQLACDDKKMAEKLPQVTDAQIKDMEHSIDAMTVQLKPLKNFILPGGGELAGLLHVARTVCRRAERWAVRLNQEDPVDGIVIQYLNRLSDLLFVMARFANFKENISEPEWKK